MAVAFGFIVLSAILIGLIAGHYIRELFSEEQSGKIWVFVIRIQLECRETEIGVA